jgi:hypothetical protein
LGFLSPLSLLYFATGEIGFAGFAAFAVYFRVYGEDDERLHRNVGLVTRNAFFYVVFAGALSLIYITIFKEQSFFPLAFTLLFSGSIIICVLSYFFYNLREEKL